MIVNKLLLALVAYSAIGMVSLAQDKFSLDPPELVKLREEHLRSMHRVAVPVLTTYVRALESQKQLFTRQGKLDAALSVDNELKDVAKQLETANSASARTGATMQLAIVSATYGSHEKKRITDITKNLRKAFESGEASIKLNTDKGAAGVDPAPFAPKATVVVYTINGQRKEKTFPEGRTLNFKDDLQ